MGAQEIRKESMDCLGHVQAQSVLTCSCAQANGVPALCSHPSVILGFAPCTAPLKTGKNSGSFSSVKLCGQDLLPA